MNRLYVFLLLLTIGLVLSCGTERKSHYTDGKSFIHVEVENYTGMEGTFEEVACEDGGIAVRTTGPEGWLAFEFEVPVAGRYKCEIRISGGQEGGTCWVEDYIENRDDRTYNITSTMSVPKTQDPDSFVTIYKDGSPLNAGIHNMKVHVSGRNIEVNWLKFTLLRKHQVTPRTLKQNMQGKTWKLVWSDEFNDSGFPDSSKWTYDIGNWGWGNNEPQYYTQNRVENARQENGNLIIEAHKDPDDNSWTSARLTTRGRVGFIYGRIEFRARVPAGDGTWAAGWLLGDSYRDELSWPLCGEIDVLECVGREIDDVTGDGINHASGHTRAYYHKQGNQITAVKEVKNMQDEFHTYSVEWYPDGIFAFVDGEKYYTYDKLDGEWEWPFHTPQNIIINLAIGGGMGGEISPDLVAAQLVLDYIRVYDLQ